MKFGRVIKWSNTLVDVGDFDSREEAHYEAVQLALTLGWTPPKWWQFWRWQESYWKWSEQDKKVANRLFDLWKENIF